MHAPGPWYQCGDKVLIDIGDRAHLVATVADWSEDTEPYARLIAAAPELLDELQRLLAAYRALAKLGYSEDDAYTVGPHNAIAKAAGSAS